MLNILLHIGLNDSPSCRVTHSNLFQGSCFKMSVKKIKVGFDWTLSAVLQIQAMPDAPSLRNLNPTSKVQPVAIIRNAPNSMLLCMLQVLTWAKQHEQRLETALVELLNNAALLEDLLSWLQWAETTLVQRDTEPLPQDITQLKTLITEHQVGGATLDHDVSGFFLYTSI